jgi:hypothetical protein
MNTRFSTLAVLIITWLGLAFISLGCQFLSYLQYGSPGGVLFQDDFSDPTSGWSQMEAVQGSLAYLDGGYRIAVNQPYTQLWGSPGLKFTDSRVEVVASKVAGADDNLFGLICRNRRDAEFYAFVISSDGYYGIALAQDDQFHFLGTAAMAPSEAILQGTAANHLRADCMGPTLAFYVNGVLLYAVQDNTLPSGEAGLIAGAQASPGTAIQFDNFQVLRP